MLFVLTSMGMVITNLFMKTHISNFKNSGVFSLHGFHHRKPQMALVHPRSLASVSYTLFLSD
jgi:hypothetical protein